MPDIIKVDPYQGTLPLVFPIAGDGYRLRDNWHVKRSKKWCSVDHSFDADIRAHNGVDIGAKLGTPAYSCVKGTVVSLPYTDFPADRYGNTVWIESTMQNETYGYRFQYSHLDKIFVQPGQEVDIETQIGLLGMTGNALRPHIHFEIHYPQGYTFDCNKCKQVKPGRAAINPYPSLHNAQKRPQKDAECTAQQHSSVISRGFRTVKNMVIKFLRS